MARASSVPTFGLTHVALSVRDVAKSLRFSLETPWKDLTDRARQAILYGIEPKKVKLVAPPGVKAAAGKWIVAQLGKEVGFSGIARRIESWYRRYRQRGEANSKMEQWLDKVMIERTCPDCNGTRVRATRLLFTIGGKTIFDVIPAVRRLAGKRPAL